MASLAAASQHNLLNGLTPVEDVLLQKFTLIDILIGGWLESLEQRRRFICREVAVEEVVLLQTARCARKAERKAGVRGDAETADGERMAQVAIWRLIKRNRERLDRFSGDREWVRIHNKLKYYRDLCIGPATHWVLFKGNLEHYMLQMKVREGWTGVSTSPGGFY